jgi:hypothetical protein
MGLPILHLDSISLPYSAIYTLRVREESENGVGFERDLIFNGSRATGCAFTVGPMENYTVFFNSVFPESSGRLGHDGMDSFGVFGAYDNFYSPVTFYSATETATSVRPIATTHSSTEEMTARSTEETATRSPGETTMPPHTPDGREAAIMAIVVVVPIAAMGFVVTLAVCCYRRRRKLSDRAYQSLTESFPDAGPGVGFVWQ